MGKKQYKRLVKKEKAARDYQDITRMWRPMSRKQRKEVARGKAEFRKKYFTSQLFTELGVDEPRDARIIAYYEGKILRKKAEANNKFNIHAIAAVGCVDKMMPEDKKLPDEIKRNIFSFLKK